MLKSTFKTVCLRKCLSKVTRNVPDEVLVYIRILGGVMHAYLGLKASTSLGIYFSNAQVQLVYLTYKRFWRKNHSYGPEIPNLLTNADNTTNISFLIFFFNPIWNDSLFLRLYELVNKCTSRTPLTRGPFTGGIWNNSLFLRLNGLTSAKRRNFF